ncbi:MAG: MFS transporter, partial [candidate division Zixibacteria bacterium]|nr:MFS transporter [candidate division Zixibacteria bacterium]
MNHTAEETAVSEKKQKIWQRTRGGVATYLATLKMFSRNARLYLIGSFLMGVNFHVFQLLLNLYLKELGFVESQIGLVISARALGATLLAIPVAIILSRVKLKPLLLTGCIMMAGFSYFITTMDELILLMGFSLLTGMSFAFFRVASGPFYMRNSTSVERTHLFSLSFGMMLLAGMVGALFSGKLVIMLTDFTGDI